MVQTWGMNYYHKQHNVPRDASCRRVELFKVYNIIVFQITDTEKFVFFSQTEKRIIKKNWNLSMLKRSFFQIGHFSK